MSNPSCSAEKQRSSLTLAVPQLSDVSACRDNVDNGTASTTTKGTTVLGRKRKADALGRVSDSHLGSISNNNNNNNNNNNSNNNSPAAKIQKKDSSSSMGSSIAAVAAVVTTTTTAVAAVAGGRGSTAGWTTCPLCGKYSSKRYALGRGISAHLHAVHTPWRPSNMALKIQRRHYEERQRQRQERRNINHQAREQQQKHPNQVDQPQEEDGVDAKKDSSNDSYNSKNPVSQVQESWSSSSSEPWEPTQQEIDDWDARILEIMSRIELDHHHHHHAVSRNGTYLDEEKDNHKPNQKKNDKRSDTKDNQVLPNNSSTAVVGGGNPPPHTPPSPPLVVLGKDRSGQNVQAYRKSLPPFIQAAADGSLATLKSMVQEACQVDMEVVVEVEVAVVEAANTAVPHEQPTNPHRSVAVQQLLDTRDRHLSTAEHWAAGGGHLECLVFLLDLRWQYQMVNQQQQQQQQQNQQQQHSNNSKNETSGSSSSSNSNSVTFSSGPMTTKKMRRRDGKTCLHYAARNGQLACVQYLLNSSSSYCSLQQQHYHYQNQNHQNQQQQLPPKEAQQQQHLQQQQPPQASTTVVVVVNETSGDGTTPLHMACYGGHFVMVQYLIQQGGADVMASNDWGCTAAHWIAMTLATNNRESIRSTCRLLQRVGVRFTDRQSQGHTPLHKAAQKLNRHVIEWMAEDKKKKKKTKKTITEGSMGSSTSHDNDSENDDIEDDDDGAGLSVQEKELAGGPDLGGQYCPSEIWTSVGGDSQFAEWMKAIAPGW